MLEVHGRQTARPIMFVDIEAADQGEVTSQFTPYSHKSNANLEEGINRFYNLPQDLAETIAGYPRNFECRSE